MQLDYAYRRVLAGKTPRFSAPPPTAPGSTRPQAKSCRFARSTLASSARPASRSWTTAQTRHLQGRSSEIRRRTTSGVVHSSRDGMLGELEPDRRVRFPARAGELSATRRQGIAPIGDQSNIRQGLARRLHRLTRPFARPVLEPPPAQIGHPANAQIPQASDALARHTSYTARRALSVAQSISGQPCRRRSPWMNARYPPPMPLEQTCES